MKKTLLKKSTWQSILSVLALGIFAWLAMSTLPSGVNQQTVYLGNGVYETAKTYGPDKTEVFTGKYDDYNRWHGVTKIETTSGSDFVRCDSRFSVMMRIFFQLISEIAMPITKAERDALGMFSMIGAFRRIKKPSKPMNPANTEANLVCAPDS